MVTSRSFRAFCQPVITLTLDEPASTSPTLLKVSLVVTSWALDTYDGSKKPVVLLVESSLKMV